MKPTSSPNVLIGAVLAGLQVLNGGAALGDVIGTKAFGIFALVVGAIQVAWHTYNQAVQVVPASAVAAVVDNTGAVVAGPAATQVNGTPVVASTTTTVTADTTTSAAPDGSAS